MSLSQHERRVSGTAGLRAEFSKQHERIPATPLTLSSSKGERVTDPAHAEPVDGPEAVAAPFSSSSDVAPGDMTTELGEA
jgi:hypothetical protein